MWIFIALLAPAFYGIANISDSLLTNKNFKSPITLIFYAYLFSLIFIPVLFIFYPISLPPLPLLPIFLLLGLFNVLYLYPYYKGLQSDDTSTAISFFGLGRIFIPVWAFLIVGEKLSLGEYTGIILIIIGSILLSMRGSIKNIKFSKAIFYILLSAFLTSFEGVFFKYLFEHGISVGTALVGEMIISSIFVLFFLLSKQIRFDIRENFFVFKKKIPLFFIEEGTTFVASFSATYAISIAPVSLVRAVGTLTPFFVLAYSKIFGKKLPNLFNEQTGTGITLKKIVLFSLTALGVFLIAR